MTRCGRLIAIPVLLIIVVWAGAMRLPHRVGTEQMQPAIVRQGVAWAEWLNSPDAAQVDRRLQDALADAIASWVKRGAAEESFGVLRSVTAERESAACVCYPFERQHALGRAADVWVGDLNQDGRANLTDLCLFAATLEKTEGGCGVYGRQVDETASALWVHVDVSGKRDRWGEWRMTSGTVQSVVWSKQQRSVQARCRAWGLTPSRRTLKLVVDKQPSAFVFDAEKQTMSLHPSLRLYVGKYLVKGYPVALGFDPVGDKEKRDDYRTPEGDFYICGKNPNSQFHKSLRLSYPNAEDAARGLKDKLINEATYKAIMRAIRKRRTPPQNTALGGDIMLHGGGGAREHWTWGCIALDNEDVDELFELLPLRTAAEVLPVIKSK